MTDANLTHIYVLLDRSGSMNLCRYDMQAGFDAFIAEQRELRGRCKVSLIQFDHWVEKVYMDRPIRNVPPLYLQPRGNTALLDAMGDTIEDVGRRLSAIAEFRRPGAVVFVVITDGYENASHRYAREQVMAMVEHQSNTYGWLFVYLGANQDAIAVGHEMGFSYGQTMTYNTDYTDQVFASTSGVVSNYRGSTMSGVNNTEALLTANFTDEDRTNAVQGPDG